MIIQVGFNSPSTLDSIELVRAKSKKRVDIFIYGKDGNLVDIVEETTNGGNDSKGLLKLEITDFTNNVLLEDSYYPKDPTKESRIERYSTGHYGLDWGEDPKETQDPGTYLFNWTARIDENEEEIWRTQIVEIVTPRVLSLLPRLRLQLDKSIKVVNPEKFCNLGYSDSQLIMYLQAGLEKISVAQPYPTWMELDRFPIQHGADLLLSTALLSALESQYLFSVDTDVASFSDQGHSFAMTHFAPLKALYDSLSASLPQRIREFKLHYVSSGSIGLEFRIGWGFWQMVNASPPGATMRGHYTSNMGMT